MMDEDEGLDEELWDPLVQPLHGAGDVIRPAVRQVVAIDHGQHDVRQTQLGDRRGELFWLV